MKSQSLFRTLFSWELEENYRFPIAESLIFVVIIYLIGFTSETMKIYQNLDISHYAYVLNALNSLSFISVFLVSFLFAKSFAGAFSSNIIKTILSYPIKRRDIIIIKFFSNLIVIYVILGALIIFDAWLAGIYLYNDNWFFVGVVLVALLINLLFLGSIAMFVSILLKNETLSILFVLFFIFGIPNFVGRFAKEFYQFFSISKSTSNIALYLLQGFYPSKAIIFNDVSYYMFIQSLSFQLGTFIILFTASLLYFVYLLEVD